MCDDEPDAPLSWEVCRKYAKLWVLRQKPTSLTAAERGMMSPTQRSLHHLKALGYQARTVERWNAFAKIRQDVWGADREISQRFEMLLRFVVLVDSDQTGARARENNGCSASVG